MDINKYYKAVLDVDLAPIVLCNLDNIIIYMNKSAIARYKKDLTGKSIFDCHNQISIDLINKVIDWFKLSIDNNIMFESRNNSESKDVYIVALRDDSNNLIGYYEKHEYRTYETKKTYTV